MSLIKIFRLSPLNGFVSHSAFLLGLQIGEPIQRPLKELHTMVAGRGSWTMRTVLPKVLPVLHSHKRRNLARTGSQILDTECHPLCWTKNIASLYVSSSRKNCQRESNPLYAVASSCLGCYASVIQCGSVPLRRNNHYSK